MDKRTLSLAVLILYGSISNAQTFDWVRQAGYHATETANAVSADAMGNAYVAGEMSPQTQFDTIVFGGSFIDSFVAKYSPSGELLWVKQITGPDTESAFDIATDVNGNSYVTGMFDQTASFDGQSISSAGDYDGFVAKYDPSGNILWAEGFGGVGAENGAGVAIDGNGDIVVSGSFTLTASFGNIMLTSQGQSDIFLARYDQQGNVLWANRYGGPGNDYPKDMDILDGSIHVTGAFQATAGFDQNTITSLGHYDAFVAKFDGDGTNIWCERGGSDNALIVEAGNSITTNTDGIIYICGTAGGTSSFGIHSFTSTAGGDYSDAFAAAYDQNGECLWLRHGGGIVADGATSIMADGVGRVIMTGSYNFGATFDQLTLPIIGQSANIFMACYDPSGTLQWLKSAGGGWGPDAGRGICTDHNGGLYLAGSFYRSAIFDAIELPWIYNETNLFIAHVDLDDIVTAVELTGSPVTGSFVPYPNPARESVTLVPAIEIEGPHALQMWNAQGEVIHSTTTVNFIDGHSEPIDISSLASGMYFCSFRSANEWITGRFVVEH